MEPPSSKESCGSVSTQKPCSGRSDPQGKTYIQSTSQRTTRSKSHVPQNPSLSVHSWPIPERKQTSALRLYTCYLVSEVMSQSVGEDWKELLSPDKAEHQAKSSVKMEILKLMDCSKVKLLRYLEPCPTCCNEGTLCALDHHDLDRVLGCSRESFLEELKEDPELLLDLFIDDPNPILPTSDHIFPAKEVAQYSLPYSDYAKLYAKLSPKAFECPVNPNSGEVEIIWNSSMSHPPHDIAQLSFTQNGSDKRIDFTFKSQDTNGWSYRDPDDGRSCGCAGLLEGCNEEWGNLRLPLFHARISKLLDRDYVWVVTQTMVSFENLALWAVHNMLTYKVYPGFWGRVTKIAVGTCLESRNS